MAEGVSALLNFPTETFRQTLDQLHRRASSIASLSLQWKDFDEHFASVNTAIKERAKELDSSRESVELRLEEVQNRERSIEEKRKEFDGKFEDLELKEKMIQEWEEEVQLEKNKYENLCKQLESKKNLQIKEVNHGYSSIIDGKSLQIYLNEHSREIDSMRFAVSMALEHSVDPAMLVLDALQGFYKQIDSQVVRRSCSVLLEELMKFPPETRPGVKKEARRIANYWVGKSKSKLETVCFLQLLACYGLASGYKDGKLLARLEDVANHSLAPALIRSLGLADKVLYFVGNLIEKKKLIEAFKFIYGFGLFGRFQQVPLLNTFLRTSMIDVENLRKENVTLEGQINASEKRLADIKYALRCIEEYKIDYEQAHRGLELQVSILEEEISKRKEAAALEDKIRKLKDGKEQQPLTLAGKKHPREDESAGKNGKEKLGVDQVKSDVSSPETNLVSESEYELKKLLDMCENNQIEGSEIASALRSSHNPEKLVLDIMNIPIPFTPGGFENLEVKPSYIPLLKQLREVAPEIDPEIRDHAKKFALHWETVLVKNTNKSPLDILCFLQFLASFKLGSIFDSPELLDFLDDDHWREEALDLCKDLGSTDKILGFILSKIKKEKYVEAVKYIYAFNVVDKLSPASVLQIYLRNSSKEIGKRPLEEQIGEIDKEIKAHEDVVKCIEDYKITGLSPEDLMERIAQLEIKKKGLERWPVSFGKPRPKHWNKHLRTRNSSDYYQTRKRPGLSAMPLQHPAPSYGSRDVLYSPPRHYVRPDLPCETELDGYGAIVTPAYHWGALGNFGPNEPSGY